MTVFKMIVTIAVLVIAIALVVVVAVQTNRGSEMTALTGSSSGKGKGIQAKKDDLLKKITIILGCLFIVGVIAMNLLFGLNG